MKIFNDGDNEVIEVPLRMQKRNFDALVKAYKDGTHVPCSGISFVYDESVPNPCVRVIATANPGQKEEQVAMGFYGVPMLDDRFDDESVEDTLQRGGFDN